MARFLANPHFGSHVGFVLFECWKLSLFEFFFITWEQLIVNLLCFYIRFWPWLWLCFWLSFPWQARRTKAVNPGKRRKTVWAQRVFSSPDWLTAERERMNAQAFMGGLVGRPSFANFSWPARKVGRLPGATGMSLLALSFSLRLTFFLFL